MKKLLFFLSMFSALTANAQTINVTFSGTGESTSVNSVKVENLMTAESIILTSGQGLCLNVLTGINQVENNKSSQMTFSPNPMTDNSVMRFTPPVEGNATITVSDISGRQIAQIQRYLDNNLQEFRLSGLKHGLWLISVKGSTFQYTGKLISDGKSQGGISIEKVSGNSYVADVKIPKEDSENVKGDADMEYSIDWVNMDYNTGDRLKFTGVSGIYSTVITDIPTENKTITFNFVACTDGDNNNYPVVDINGQVWMAENLKTTKYYDNTDIPLVNSNAGWNALVNTDKAYCYNNDDPGNADIYGALYTWAAAMNGAGSSILNPSGVQGVCPTGWHLPGKAEWQTLITYLGGDEVAGKKLKETGTLHWIEPNAGATDEVGFAGLPGGFREETGTSSNIRYYGLFWTSEENGEAAWAPGLSYSGSTGYIYSGYKKKNGFSVRCIAGAPPTISTTAVTTFTSTEATVGGEVTFDGNATVTENGVYWGTNPSPGTTGSKFQIGSGTGPFSASLPGLTPNTMYYVQAYATNSNGTSFGEEAIFTTSIAIGDSYQGGIVAYILVDGDLGYDVNVKHGLIVAPADQSTGAEWGCGGTFISGLGTAIGTGSQNTTAIVDIVTGCTIPGIAAKLCDDLDLNDFTDWYLPSKDELNQLYLNKVAIGVIGDNWYLSSSQYDGPSKKEALPIGSGYVWGQDFLDGTQYKIPKGNLLYVRAVRSF